MSIKTLQGFRQFPTWGLRITMFTDTFARATACLESLQNCCWMGIVKEIDWVAKITPLQFGFQCVCVTRHRPVQKSGLLKCCTGSAIRQTCCTLYMLYDNAIDYILVQYWYLICRFFNYGFVCIVVFVIWPLQLLCGSLHFPQYYAVELCTLYVWVRALPRIPSWILGRE